MKETIELHQTQQTFVLMKASLVFVFRRRLQDVFINTNIFVLVIHLQDVFNTFSRRLQDVFKMSSRRLAKTSSRRLQDIFKTPSRGFRDILSSSTVLGNIISRHLRDVFKTFLRRTARTIIYRRFV